MECTALRMFTHVTITTTRIQDRTVTPPPQKNPLPHAKVHTFQKQHGKKQFLLAATFITMKDFISPHRWPGAMLLAQESAAHPTNGTRASGTRV